MYLNMFKIGLFCILVHFQKYGMLYFVTEIHIFYLFCVTETHFATKINLDTAWFTMWHKYEQWTWFNWVKYKICKVNDLNVSLDVCWMMLYILKLLLTTYSICTVLALSLLINHHCYHCSPVKPVSQCVILMQVCVLLINAYLPCSLMWKL